MKLEELKRHGEIQMKRRNEETTKLASMIEK
jgi:hypothetical protein